MTAGLLPKLTVLALMVIPLFYGAVYLYANWDPYANMQGIKAGIVNLDEGAKTEEKVLHVGDTVSDQLIEDGTFSWHRQETLGQATAKVNSGELSFALAIPKDFSASLASPQDFDKAKKAQLTFITNDANNYFLGNIVNQLAQEIHGSVAQEAGKQVADSMLTGFGRIHLNLSEAADGAEELAKGSKDLRRGLIKLEDGSDTVASGVTTAKKGADDLEDGAGALAKGSSDLADGLNTLKDGTKDLPANTKNISNGATSLNKGLIKLESGAESVAEGNNELATTFSIGVKTFDKDVAAMKKALKELKADLPSSTVNPVEEAAPSISLDESTAGIGNSKALDALVENGTLTQEQAAQISQEISSSASTELTKTHNKQANQQLATAWKNRPHMPDTTGVGEAIDGVGEKIDAVSTKVHGLEKNLTTLAKGAQSVADGASDAQDGAQQLKKATAVLAKAAPELQKGVASAYGGADTFSAGAGKLKTGSDDLASGLKKLSTGAQDLHEGISTANAGSKKLKDGSGELYSGILDGVQEVPNLNDEDKDRVSTVIADPVNVQNLEQARAASYGAGLAPFFVPLALWIGAFILVQIMRTLSWRTLASNLLPVQIAMVNWLPFFVMSLAQTILLYGTVNFGLGLDAAHPIGGFLLLVLAAMAFTALIHGFVALLGNPGKFVVLVLLVLQLVTAGGTMPWQTLPGPLLWAHSVLPMSHVVTGLRALFYGGDLGSLPQVIAVLIGYILFGWLLSTLAAHRYRTWSVRRLQPELVE